MDAKVREYYRRIRKCRKTGQGPRGEITKKLCNQFMLYPILEEEEGVRVLHSGKVLIFRSRPCLFYALPNPRPFRQDRDGPRMTQGSEAIPSGLIGPAPASWLLRRDR
jgi:hypothetical protein